MSTYAQVSTLKGLAPSIKIDATTVPASGQVQDFLEYVEQEINAILGNLGYTVPVPASAVQSRVLLQDLAATGALAKVLRARALGVDTSLLEAARDTEKNYRDRLKALKSSGDPFELPDAPQINGVLKTPDERSASFADDTTLNLDVDHPAITRDQRF